jgi:hypothetical protein
MMGLTEVNDFIGAQVPRKEGEAEDRSTGHNQDGIKPIRFYRSFYWPADKLDHVKVQLISKG